jgi:hypothetical protein
MNFCQKKIDNHAKQTAKSNSNGTLSQRNCFGRRMIVENSVGYCIVENSLWHVFFVVEKSERARKN